MTKKCPHCFYDGCWVKANVCERCDYDFVRRSPRPVTCQKEDVLDVLETIGEEGLVMEQIAYALGYYDPDSRAYIYNHFVRPLKDEGVVEVFDVRKYRLTRRT